MPNLTDDVLDSALNQYQRQQDDALGRDIRDQAAPIRRTLFGGLPDLGSLLGGLDLGQQQPSGSQQPGGFGGLPGLNDLLSGLDLGVTHRPETTGTEMGAASSPEPSRTVGMTPGSPGPGPSAAMPAAPAPTGDLRAYTRAKALSLGIDPDVAERVAQSEGGFDDPVRQSDVVYRGQREQSYGPFQLNVTGGLGSAALQQGIDPRNPAHVYRAIDFALENAARNGWGAFHGAARVGVGDRQGIGVGQPGPAPAVPQPVAPPQQAQGDQAGQPGMFQAGSYTPNQITAATAEGLDYETALAVCGPAAAIAFARRNGRNPTMQEALGLAKQVGWTAAAGMAGPASQQRLLRSMGIAASLQEGAPDWKRVAVDVGRGNPVIISTPGHYFVAERYNPDDGTFDFGQSAAVLKAARGRTWFRPDELSSLGMGEAHASLYMDSPESPSPSVVAGPSRNAGAVAPQAAPAPSSPPTTGSAPPPAGGSGGDTVTIEHIDDHRRLVIPRSTLAGYLRSPAPGVPVMWRVVDEGAPAARTSLSDTAEMSPDTGTVQPAFQAPAGRAAGGGVMQMLRQPTMGPDTTTGQAYDPRDADQGPRESGYTLPAEPATYGDAGDAPQVPSQNGYSPAGTNKNTHPAAPAVVYGPPLSEAGPEQPSSPLQQATDWIGGKLKPIYDTLGNVVGYVQANQEQNRRNVEQANAAQGYTPGGAELASPFQVVTGALDQALRPAGDAPAFGARLREINDIAARDQGLPSTDVRGMFTVAQDPAWRAAHPDLAAEYDDVEQQYQLAIMGQVGDAPRVTGRHAPTAADAAQVPSLIERGRAALDANAERVAAADARMAAEGSTVAPGTLGVVTGNPLEASSAARRRIIPPDVADTLDFPLRVPEDPAFARAVEAAGGRIDPERGVDLNLIRYQGPDAAGGTATRGMPFYIAGPPGTPNPYARATGAGHATGGTERIEGPTRFRNPLFIRQTADKGFLDDALEQLDVRRRGDEEAIRRAEENLASRQNYVERFPQPAGADYVAVAQRELDDLRNGVPVAGRNEIDQQINAIRARTQPDTPERTAALQALVARYGGDPSVIPDLVRLRPNETESGYAIIENIIAANARKQQRDGVIYLGQRMPELTEIDAHPAVKAAEAERFELNRRLGQIPREVDARAATLGAPAADAERLDDPQIKALIDEYNRLYERRQQMPQVMEDARTEAYRDLSTSRIEELADPREASNPTPGAPISSPEEVDSLLAQYRAAIERAMGARTDAEAERLHNEAEAIAARLKATRSATTPPGYTLRSDIPRRAETRASTITENTAMAEAGRAYDAAVEETNRLTLERNKWAVGTPQYQEAEAALTEARTRLKDAWDRYNAFEQAGQSEYVTANATAGALPASATPDRLASVNRVLGQGVASAVSGGVGAQVNQQMNPDDPYAGVKGFAAGALVPPLAARGGRALARRLGREAGAEGALIGLGDVPPSKLREPMLPGTEAIPARRPVALPEAAGDATARAEMARHGDYLPGLEDPLRPLGGPETSSPAPIRQQTMREALPGMLRDLNAPKPQAEAAGGTEGAKAIAEMRANRAPELPAMSTPPGLLRRIGTAISEVAAPWANRVQIVRYGGMLADTAGQVLNAASNLVRAGVDVGATPVAAGLDVGRVAALRAAGRDAERQVWMSELPLRLAGMRRGATVGLEAAGDVLRTGARGAEAAKLEQSGRGFNSGSGKVDLAFELPLRTMAAADAAFRTSAQGGHLMAEAYAAARRANGGRPPTDAMIAEAAKDPKVLEKVVDLAKRSVFQEDRAVTDAYEWALRKAGPLVSVPAKLEMPFTKTPYNVVAQGMGMTPAGLATTLYDIKMGKSAREVEHQLARVMIGTAVGAAAMSSYAAGNLTGPYPDDPKERSTLPPGWRPWSYKVTVGNQTYYAPIAPLGPLAVPMVAAILTGESAKKGTLSPEWAGRLAAGLGQYAEDQTFFKGFSNISETLANPDKKWQQTVEQIAASYAPYGAAGREIQRIMGMSARDPEGALEAVLAMYPGTADLVAPRQDVLGRPASMGLGGPAGAVVRAGVEDDAAVIRAYRTARKALPLQAPKQIKDPDNDRLRTLTPQQRHRWRRVFGQALREEWANQGNPTEPDVLDDVSSAARETANDTVLGRR